jgi:hyperosmotically inducible protein
MTLKRSLSVIAISSFLSSGLVIAQDNAGQNNSADNTKVNTRDRSTNEPTADNQRNNMSDRDITKQIRQSIDKDKSLSSYAHNVKVVTQNGQVTLKGPVRSDEEKRSVEAKATAVAGENNVKDQLDVKEKQ